MTNRKAPRKVVLPVTPIEVNTKVAAAMLGVSDETLRQIPFEDLPFRWMGNERRYRVASLEKYSVAQLDRALKEYAVGTFPMRESPARRRANRRGDVTMAPHYTTEDSCTPSSPDRREP